MAISSCPACKGKFFELKQMEPKSSAFKLYGIQCASCGAVVGVMDYMNIGAVLEKQNKALKAIAAKVGAYVDL